jgi:hypothetical protein
MEKLTTGEFWTAVLAVASAIVLLSNAAKAIASAWSAAKAPNQAQNDRIAELEHWREEVDRKLNTDKASISNMRDENQAILQALLALLDHGINGNNIDQMKDARAELQDHLIHK